MVASVNVEPAIWARIIQPDVANLDPRAAEYFLSWDFPPADHDRMEELAEKARLGTITDAELAGASGERFPGVPATLLGAIAFLVQHESYHIGQLAFVRKYLGRPSMSYR